MLRPGSRLRAFSIVTGLSVAAGALLGILVIGGVLGVAAARDRMFTARDVVGLLALGALWGSVFGVVLGPLTAFGLLRAVPLWRAVLGTAAGSVMGVLASFLFGANPFVAIPLGFVAGAIFLRARHGRRPAITDRTTTGAPDREPPDDG